MTKRKELKEFKLKSSEEESTHILAYLIDTFDKTLSVDDDTYAFTHGKKKLGAVAFEEDDSLIFMGEGMKPIYEEMKERIKKDKVPTEEEINAVQDETIFKGMSMSIRNINYLKELEKAVKALGIEKVNNDKFESQHEICSKLTLFLGARISGSHKENEVSGLDTKIKSIVDRYMSTKTETYVQNLQNSYPTDLPNEEIVDIKIKEVVVGKYYKDRNIIFLLFDFLNQFDVYCYKTELHQFTVDILEILGKLGLEKKKVGDIKKKRFVMAFQSSLKDERTNIEVTIKSTLNNIDSYNNSIADSYQEVSAKRESLQHINMLLSSSGDEIYDEVEKIEELPFVEKVDILTSSFKIKFKPTLVKIPNYSFEGDRKDFYFYSGNPVIEVSASGFKLTNKDYTVSNRTNGHPHANSGGGMCFGDGAGNKKIYELLHSRKLSDMTKMLWFWIKTFRSGGAHVHDTELFPSMMSRGLPIFDGDKKRFGIDKTDLSKKDCYNDNIKKYEDVETLLGLVK